MSSTNTTNLPKLELSSSGVSLPEEGDVLNGVIQDFKNAFGDNIKFHNANGEFLLSTPQGQLATSIAAIVSDRNRLLAYYVNQVDPNYAVGRMQDGIGRIYFIERKRATNTTVVARCSGAKGTVFPLDIKAKDQQGNVYQSITQSVDARTFTEKEVKVVGNDGQYVFDEHGNHVTQKENCADIAFECLEKGAITCPFGTLTERYQVIQGWERIVNVEDGIVGREDESQAQFEQRRRQSVAQNSMNSVDSIMASLLTLDQVEDAYVIENYEGTEKKITNQLVMKPHSVYICVYLRTLTAQDIANMDTTVEEKIARAIWNKKTPGCALNGQTQVKIKDNTKGSDGNLLYSLATAPEYLINFDYATPVPICIKVTLSKPKPITGDPVALVQDKIESIFTGQDGSRKPRIGSQVLASKFYCAVQSLGDWVRIISIKIGFSNEVEGGDNTKEPTEDIIQVAVNQIPTLSKKNIQLVFEDDTQGVSNG